MKGLIARYHGEGLSTRGDAFETLARSIVGQQISVKAADSVWQKLEALAHARKGGSMKPKVILGLEEAELRSCGLSRQKIAYLNEISSYFIKNKVNQGYFDRMSDAEVIAGLTTIKGIGKWTAEMFLIFHLMRPDVFPVDDIGLQKAIQRHYSLSDDGDKINKKELVALSDVWRPWRTVVTWYLWRALDPVPVAY